MRRRDNTPHDVSRILRARRSQHFFSRPPRSTRGFQCVEHAFQSQRIKVTRPLAGIATSRCRVWLHYAVRSLVLFHAFVEQARKNSAAERDPLTLILARRDTLDHQCAVHLLRLLFLVGTSFCVAAQIGSPQSQTDQSAKGAVKATYKAYLRAWKDKDYTALNNLLSDDYQAVNFQGIVSEKANEIATAREDRTYDTLSGDFMSVVLFGRLCGYFRSNRGQLEG